MNTLNNIKNEKKLNEWIIDKFNSEGVNDIVIDGSLNSELYYKQNIKILFLYLETYGYDKCGKIRMAEKFKKWMTDTRITRTFRNCALLADTVFELIDNSPTP